LPGLNVAGERGGSEVARPADLLADLRHGGVVTGAVEDAANVRNDLAEPDRALLAMPETDDVDLALNVGRVRVVNDDLQPTTYRR
jgi:hypothetical protein